MARPSGARRTLNEHDMMLADEAGRFFYDPVGFTRFAFPWGEPSGPLAGHPGPDTWQVEVMDYIGEALRTSKKAVRVAISSGHGAGKELVHGTHLLTPDNGAVKIQDLKVGDRVFGRDGHPCTITGFFPQGVKALYRITFSDRTSVLAGDDHQWLVSTEVDRLKGRPLRVVTTREMRGHPGRRYQLPLCEPVAYPISETYIPPYVMGYVIGNGSLCTPGAVKVSCFDPEVYARIGALLPEGYALRGRAETYQHISRGAEARWDDRGNELWRAFCDLGLAYCRAEEKFIPEPYLRNSVEARVELLRGLMDADGCCVNVNEKGRPNHYRVTFNTSSPQLRDHFIWLVQSLGGTCSYNTDARRETKVISGSDRASPATTNHDNYQLSPSFPMWLNPFHLRRKAEVYERYRATNKRRPVKAVRSIEYERHDEAYCLSVDSSDSTYLLGDCTVTHNTAFFSMLLNWFMTTRPDANVVATANTKTQLQTKLWRELAVWHKRSLYEPWFEWMATSLRAHESPASWVANAIPWSENNPEAFAGLHGQHVALFFDEASAIPDIIWETVEGAMTSEEHKVLFVVAGNPTRSSGGFYRCFYDPKSPWKTFQVDSRTARMTNKAQLQEWIERWGADSNFAKVRIYGQFPSVGDVQFIPTPDVDRAGRARPLPIEDDYLVFGVDVARKGSDTSVICPRRSNRVEPALVYRIPDTMVLASRVAEEIDKRRPDTVFVDGNGIGAGVVDRLRQLGFPVVDVLGQSAPVDRRYYNKRAENYGGLRDWLRGDVSLPDDSDLKEELIALEYDLRGDRILLEDKDDLRDRLGRSPDKADALALTFAEPINRVREQYHAGAASRLHLARAGRNWRTL